MHKTVFEIAPVVSENAAAVIYENHLQCNALGAIGAVNIQPLNMLLFTADLLRLYSIKLSPVHITKHQDPCHFSVAEYLPHKINIQSSVDSCIKH